MGTIIMFPLFLNYSYGATDLGVIPVPRKVEPYQESFVLSDFTAIIASPVLTENGKSAISILLSTLADKKNLSINVIDHPSIAQKPNTILIGNPEKDKMVAERMSEYGLSITPEMRNEGYVMGIGNKGIVIGAVSDAGIFYGTVTLKQIVLNCPGNIYTADVILPGVKIHDWPALEMRGIHDDVARGQVSTMQDYKDMIRSLSEFKLNTIMLYMEDLFRFKAYPEIGVGRGSFTKAEIDELEAFAKPYHVEIIPIFQLLDHSVHILDKERFLPLAEFPGAGCFRICDETYEFYDNCIKELADAFDSDYFHAGLDESWDLGTGRSKSLVDSLGRGTVHAQHYTRVHDLLAKHGKKMMFYNRISIEHPEILDMIPKDIIHMYYNYDATDSFAGVATAAAAGFQFGVHPGMANWFRFFPTLPEAIVNVRNLTLEAVKNNSFGTAVCHWGNPTGQNFRELLWYGYAYQGEVAWSPETNATNPFGKHFFSLWNGPGTAPYFKAIYSLLEKWPSEWNRGRNIVPYFRHPFLPLHRNYVLPPKAHYQIANDATVVLSLIEILRPMVKYRAGDLDYLEFCALTNLNLMQSIRLVNDLNSVNCENLSAEQLYAEKLKYFERIKKLRDDLTKLKDMFENLWLRTNLPANLNYIIDDYERLEIVWDEVAKRVRNGHFSYDPLTPAEWIYHPDGFIKKEPIKHVYFRKSLTKPDNLHGAHIQLYGDTHVKLFVNKTFLGEQFVRRVHVSRGDAVIKLYDIAPYLRKGVNVITIEAQNYLSGSTFREPGGPIGCAGFHLYGELTYDNNAVELILSDASWKVSKVEQEGWMDPGFNDENWENAMIDQKPRALITYPDFSENRRGFMDFR